MLNFLCQNWSDLLIAIVGLSAIAVYYIEKSDKLRTAATLIVGQIESIEKRVTILKEDPDLGYLSAYYSKEIIGENLWEQYKHMFVKKLSEAEYNCIQLFFEQAEQIERARREIIGNILNAWGDKSTAEHQVIAMFVKEYPEDYNRRTMNFQQIYRPLDLVFTPEVLNKLLTKSLKNFTKLSGTTAYQKVLKSSYNR